MAVQKKPESSMWERTEYDIISETETDDGITAVIRCRSGGTVVECRIPGHTTEEEEKLAADITYALMQVLFTGQDISRIEYMEIIL